jgi:hypothetical protein
MAEASERSSKRVSRTVRAEAEAGLRRADFSLIISMLALLASGLTVWTAHDALRFNKTSQTVAQKSLLFVQFQQQYLAVSSQFPAQLNDPTFRPARDSGDYDRLEAYWIFCFSEWYATQRVNPDVFGDLWMQYYAPLIADGIDIPSLHYVLEDTVATHSLNHGEWGPFLQEIARIAQEDGHPLRPELEQRLARLPKSGE